MTNEAKNADMLTEIFQLQEHLNDGTMVKNDVRNRDGKVLTMADVRAAVEAGDFGPNGLPNTWLRNFLGALQREGTELEECLLVKWWSKDKIDMQNIRVEIVDIMHFLVSLAICAGLTPEEFHRLYTAKHKVNQQRQEQGYNQANKTEADNKTIV